MFADGAPWHLLQVAVEPVSDRDALVLALERIAADDPSFAFRRDPQTDDPILLLGTGEQHLDRVIATLLQQPDLRVTVGAPQVAYRETITRRVEQDYTHRRSTFGAGQFARLKLVFTPNLDGLDNLFESRIPPGAILEEHIAGVERGLQTVLGAGPFAGYPVAGVKTTVIDGAYHNEDSSPRAFEAAARGALREAAPKLGFQVLEPIMKAEVLAPAQCSSAVMDVLNLRRGEIERQAARHGDVTITAMVPLSNTFRIHETLLQATGGQAQLVMTYAAYAPVPDVRPFDDDPPAAPAVALR